jgi:hypothetical protein
MTQSEFTFTVRATSPDLHFKFVFDGKEVFSDAVTSERTFKHCFDDENDQDHVVEFFMSGKTFEHTVVDDAGVIVDDHVIEIFDFSLEGVESTQLFYKLNTYHHSFNDENADIIEDKFYGIMGCNGKIEFKFSSPVYFWFLENI